MEQYLKRLENSLTHSEEITNPKRYTSNGIECWDFWLRAELDPLIASAVKYVWRYKHKNGLEDLKKSLVFLEKAYSLTYIPVTFRDPYVFYIKDLPDMTPLQLLFITQASLTVINEIVYKESIKNMVSIIHKIIEEEYA